MSWPTVALADVFTIARGGSPRPIDAFYTEDADGVNWIMIGDTSPGKKHINSTKRRIKKEGVTRSRRVYPGDFLLTNSMSFGRPYILETEGCIHDGWLVLSPRRNDIDPNYFYYLLGSDVLYSQFSLLAAGAVVKNLNIEVVKGVEVALPPLPEQRRIAEILDRAEALRAKRRATIALLECLAQAIFVELFGDPVSNTKGWPQVAFGDVCDCRLGKMLDQGKQTGHHLRPYLRNANIQWFQVNIESVFEMDFEPSEREKFLLEPGDLLICEGGEPGRAAIWDGSIAECYFQKALHRARPRNDRANSDYIARLLWFLAKGGGLRDHITSATIAHLTGEKLNAMAIPLPPLSQQNQFAGHIATLEKLKTLHRASLAELDALFASLQHRAFRGEL